MPSLVRRADQRWPARALLIYVGAIVGPTLVVLYLGIAAVRRQQDALESLSTTNQRLQEARLVDAIEQRAGNLASAALQDPALQTLSRVEWNAPEGVQAAQQLFDEVRRQHPLVRQYFILEGGVPRLPRLDDPLPRALGALLDGSASGDRDRFKKTFEAADTLERAGELERARALFAQCSQLAVTEAARAIARARVARADERLGRIEDATRSWRALAADPSNTYNLSGRPQALVAGVELARLTTPTDPDRGGILTALRRDLVNRRWPLTPSQAEYFVRSLDDATGSRTTMAETRLFEDLALAEAVQHGFVLPRPIEANRAYATTLRDGGTNRQIYYSRPSLNASFVIGLSVDLDWTRDVLVPALLQELNLSSTAWTLPILRTEQVGTGFRRAFPFWSVSLEPRTSAGQTLWTRGTLAITGTTVAVLTVLLVGVVMVMRDAARESAMARLRSELVSGVSHDLKTPLSVIRLYAETLAADPDADACERRSHYDVIVQESVRLSQLIACWSTDSSSRDFAATHSSA
jgi:signal transduction histidine kinase